MSGMVSAYCTCRAQQPQLTFTHINGEGTMSKDKSQKVVVKKGAVINRKHNRTIDTSVARRDPKWEDIGHGIRKLKGPGNQTAYIRLEGGKFRSVTRKVVDVACAPKDAPNASE